PGLRAAHWFLPGDAAFSRLCQSPRVPLNHSEAGTSFQEHNHFQVRHTERIENEDTRRISLWSFWNSVLGWRDRGEPGGCGKEAGAALYAVLQRRRRESLLTRDHV